MRDNNILLVYVILLLCDDIIKSMFGRPLVGTFN